MWLDVVEFADVGMLDGVYQHLAANDNQKRREDLAGPQPGWQCREAMR